MPEVCFYFQVHQPMRVKRYRIFDISKDHSYFNDSGEENLNNKRVLRKVAEKCYLPANETIGQMIKERSDFKIAFSFSGVFLEQLMCPEFCDVLESFQRLVDTGQVEVLSETYYHSLACLYSRDEFREQVRMHRTLVRKLFGFTPTIFRNTELIYNNEIAKEVERMGYRGVLAEGADHVLGWRNANFVYRPAGSKRIRLLLKNYKLSDDIAFRFSAPWWEAHPLTASKFASWISAINGNGHLINLFMDYETFGEHQWRDTGIFEFLRALPGEILKHRDNAFCTPSEAVERYEPMDEIDIPNFISWADVERDLSAWRSNAMQEDALGKLYAMRERVLSSGDAALIRDWRRLQTSDHFYYMCTKWFQDGDVHKYFNPYESPYEAFIAFMNALSDVIWRVEQIEMHNKL